MVNGKTNSINNDPQTISYRAKWFFGVIFAIGSVGALLSSNFIVSLIDLMLALILIPPFMRLWQQLFKLQLSRMQHNSIIIILLGLFMFTAVHDITRNRPNNGMNTIGFNDLNKVDMESSDNELLPESGNSNSSKVEFQINTTKNVTCEVSCSENSCNGTYFTLCTIVNNCKTPIYMGIVRGKCGVECRMIEECDHGLLCDSVTNKCRIYRPDDAILFEQVTYKILNVTSFTRIDGSYWSIDTNGKFIKVTLEIENNAKQTINIYSTTFRLEDHKQRIYDRFQGDELYIADGLSFMEQLQPGLPVVGSIVFEVPIDSRKLVLVISSNDLLSDNVKYALLPYPINADIVRSKVD